MVSGTTMHSRLAIQDKLEQHWRGLLLFLVCLLGGGAFVLAGLNIRSAIFSPFALPSSDTSLAAVADQLDISSLLPPNTVSAPTVAAPSPTTAGLPPGVTTTTPTPTELRAQLKQAGATDAQLAELSDEQLLQAYGVAAGLSSSPTLTPTPSTTPTPPELPNKEALLALPPATIRQLLQQSGIAATTLQGLSDEQVLKIFKDTVAELDKSGKLAPVKP